VVSFFESVFADHSKDHPMAVAQLRSDTLTRDPYTTLLDATHHSELDESPRRRLHRIRVP